MNFCSSSSIDYRLCRLKPSTISVTSIKLTFELKASPQWTCYLTDWLTFIYHNFGDMLD